MQVMSRLGILQVVAGNDVQFPNDNSQFPPCFDQEHPAKGKALYFTIVLLQRKLTNFGTCSLTALTCQQVKSLEIMLPTLRS